MVVLVSGADAPLRRWRERRHRAHARHGADEPSWQQRMLSRGSIGLAFLVGALVSFPGISYLNALDHIVRLNPSTLIILVLVLGFCFMQQILLEVPLVAAVVAPDQTEQTVIRGQILVRAPRPRYRPGRPGLRRHPARGARPDGVSVATPVGRSSAARRWPIDEPARPRAHGLDNFGNVSGDGWRPLPALP